MVGYYLIEHPDYWEIPLVGKPVCRFTIDMSLTLEFFEPEGEETRIEIGGHFRLKLRGVEYNLSAENRTELGPVFHLFRKTVQSAVAAKSGTLELKFVEDAQLTVPSTPEFESWQVIGTRGLRVVCTPSGQIFTWQADPPEGTDGGIH